MPHRWTVFLRDEDGVKNTKRHLGIDHVIFYIHEDGLT